MKRRVIEAFEDHGVGSVPSPKSQRNFALTPLTALAVNVTSPPTTLGPGGTGGCSASGGVPPPAAVTVQTKRAVAEFTPSLADATTS